MTRFPLERYAATIAHYSPHTVDLELTLEGLRLCDRLDQIREFPGGFVAWLRCLRSSLPLFQVRAIGAIRLLSDAELTQAPVLYVMEAVALQPGHVITELKTLARLPGVEAWAGHTAKGQRWTVRPIRRVEQRGVTGANAVTART